ncbi:uncharacterized protein LOC134468992 [Engraulis encrasicolus]|uniref:uncharacterized protein LOC134468992 n=1 Tax=Engraulis encrasicolus TaxID=184585 RepID=UPI002FD5A526
MGNSPSEASMGSRLKCIKCQKVLPPCTSFSHLYQATFFDRRVHVFNGGEYYRPIGVDMAYECEGCFNGVEVARRQEEAQVQVQLTVRSESESESDVDDLLQILAKRCSAPISSLSLAHLSSEQLVSVFAALDTLLFQDWLSKTPSLHTLQHTQVLLTELCAMSLDGGDVHAFLDSLSNQVQSLLETIVQSATSTSENLLLCQSLYLSMMLLASHTNTHQFIHITHGPSDAVLVARRWSGQDFAAENLLVVDLLSSLMTSLRAATLKWPSVAITKMELCSLELLLRHLTGDKKSHARPTKALRRLVGGSRWTPEEAMALLRCLVDTYADDNDAIAEVLTLLRVQEVSPSWTDELGQTMAESLARLGSQRFLPELQETLNKRDEGRLESALAEWKSSPSALEMSVDMDTVRSISMAVLRASKNSPEDEVLVRDAWGIAGDLQQRLFKVSSAVHATKGWWPTATQMVRWCTLMLQKQETGLLETIVMEEDPCVIAMVAAAHACMGLKLNVVTSADSHKEWCEFYEYLGISLSTNRSETTSPQSKAYEVENDNMPQWEDDLDDTYDLEDIYEEDIYEGEDTYEAEDTYAPQWEDHEEDDTYEVEAYEAEDTYEAHETYESDDTHAPHWEAYDADDTYHPEDNYNEDDTHVPPWDGYEAEDTYEAEDAYEAKDTYAPPWEAYEAHDNYEGDDVYVPQWEAYDEEDTYHERTEEDAYEVEDTYEAEDTYETKDTYVSQAYEADVVYGRLEDFVADYFFPRAEAKARSLCRAFLVEERGVSGMSCRAECTKLAKLEGNASLMFAAECVQSLMANFETDVGKLKRKFIMSLCQMLLSKLDEVKAKDTDTQIVTILQNLSGKRLPSTEVSILNFFEKLLKTYNGETESDNSARTSLAGKACLEILFSCAVKFQALKNKVKEVFQRVLNLVSAKCLLPVEALSLLSALTHRHRDLDAIMKVLHLMEMYQISSEWTDGSGQSLLVLLNTLNTNSLMPHLEKSFKNEKTKSLDCLLNEIRLTKYVDEHTLERVSHIVRSVRALIDSGDITKHTDVQHARSLSKSMDTGDLGEVLAILCTAIHKNVDQGHWWPRDTQMISWCLLALAENGELLEMGTGEGKSCVIAMFAALRGLRGEKVDIVSSSAVLCERDAQLFHNFYEQLGLTVDTNTNKDEDEKRKCYQRDVVYGTIAAFAADHLHKSFEMKDLRSDRSYQCVIVDEVDSLMLDEGVQLTYLSSPMVSMQHLNTLLSMIWSHVCQYGYLTTEQQTFVQGPPASFFKAIFDSIDTEGTEIEDAMDVLGIAESCGIVPPGFTEDIYKSKKNEILSRVKTVSQDKVVEFFQLMEKYVPYDFILYTLDADGLLSLRTSSSYNDPDILELSFLVLDDGLCCPLYESAESLVGPIAQLIREKIQYTPCENESSKVSIPAFLKTLVEAKAAAWVRNAFLAVRLSQGREYVVEDGAVCPVDYRSTGVVESNKRWGDGLQQFLEMKHQVKLSTISTVTNYMSNVAFFQKYQGQIYGTTGTLGTESDLTWLRDLYPTLSACRMPAFNRRKLCEVDGLLKTSAQEWRAEIKRVVVSEVSPNDHRGGRAALVICESINLAREVYNMLRGAVPGVTVLYSRSDRDSLSVIDRQLQPGDVIVATNLAGRGTDIKVSDEVNNSGGLIVVLTFLPLNNRVERQAFGRTARKGTPGSAQMVLNMAHLGEDYGQEATLEGVKRTRSRLAQQRLTVMRNDVTEMRLREDLFAEYCKTLQAIYRDMDGDQEGATVAIMNEFWGIWLQAKSGDIEELRRSELLKSLKVDLAKAQEQCLDQTSPCASIYHYIDFANLAMSRKEWDVSIKLFERAMEKDASWAAVAFYSHAYCAIKQQESGYLARALDDLRRAKASLGYLSEECTVCLQFVKLAASSSSSSSSSSESGSDEGQTCLEKQFTTRCSMFSCFEKNISDAMAKLEEIQKSGRDAVAKKEPMFSLVADADEALQEEACNLYSRGLKYIFTVEQEARFPWEAVLVFMLGVLQVVGGALLTAFTFGTLAQVGVGMIVEGVSDMISGVESLVTGKFSWQAWAIEKAISIGVSLISFGVGKLVTKGFKAVKMLKGAVKQLMAVPKLKVKGGLSAVMKTNLKNAVKTTAKKLAENITMYAIGKAEKEIIKQILAGIKEEVKEGIVNNTRAEMEKEPVASSVDAVILLHLADTRSNSELSEDLQDDSRKTKMLDVFKRLTNRALLPFYDDLTWQNKLNSSILSVLGSLEAKGKAKVILNTIKAVHMTTLAADAIATILGLFDKFFANFANELDEFKQERVELLHGDLIKAHLHGSNVNKLRDLKKEVSDAMSVLLADALVEVFHQKFSSHFISHAQGKANKFIRTHVRAGLRSGKTEAALLAGQKRCAESLQRKAAMLSHSHADKVLDSNTEGTMVDIKVLAVVTTTRVMVLIEAKQGRLARLGMLMPSPSSGTTSHTITLIYRPTSDRYDVRINNKVVRVGGNSTRGGGGSGSGHGSTRSG